MRATNRKLLTDAYFLDFDDVPPNDVSRLDSLNELFNLQVYTLVNSCWRQMLVVRFPVGSAEGFRLRDTCTPLSEASGRTVMKWVHSLIITTIMSLIEESSCRHRGMNHADDGDCVEPAAPQHSVWEQLCVVFLLHFSYQPRTVCKCVKKTTTCKCVQMHWQHREKVSVPPSLQEAASPFTCNSSCGFISL